MAGLDTTVAPRALAPAGRRKKPGASWGATVVLLLGALYCLVPVLWVLTASSKSKGELFSTLTFLPSTHLFENIAQLSTYNGGIFWHWMLNTALYAGVGAAVSTYIAALSGHVLAKFDFPGKGILFTVLLMGVLVPGVVLAVPQYLLLAKVGLAGTFWSVLLPQFISPYSIYLARVYAAASVPVEVVEAARTEGAGEFRIFTRLVLPMMLPGLITIFLFQFVAVWNNFMLPFIMLGDQSLFPVTVGLSTLLHTGATQPALYTLVITGSLIAVLPLIVLFLLLQRYWKVDLGGAVKA